MIQKATKSISILPKSISDQLGTYPWHGLTAAAQCFGAVGLIAIPALTAQALGRTTGLLPRVRAAAPRLVCWRAWLASRRLSLQHFFYLKHSPTMTPPLPQRPPRGAPLAPGAAARSNAKPAQPVGSTTHPEGHGVPLWRQLNEVATVLVAVCAGKSWAMAQLDINPALRPGVQALSFTALRHYGMAQAVRALLAKRAPSPAVDALLCSTLALALAQHSAEDAADAALPAASPTRDALEAAEPAAQTAQTAQRSGYALHTLVNQAVEAAKHQPSTRAQASFVNACLRRFLRERDALVAQALQQPQAQWNHPAWWIARLRRDYPQDWQKLLQANAGAGPLTLRINTSKTTVTHVSTALAAMNIEANAVAHAGLELARSTYVPGLPGYAEGWFSVQDAAAQLAAPLLLQAALTSSTATATTALRVLDACAAPGGKTAHLLEYAATQGRAIELLAIDVDAGRCERIHENLARLQLHADVQAADAAQPSTWWDGRLFDAVLLDAPCTASGIVRRHPDIRWLRRETDVAQLAAQQRALLKALWPLLAPGGVLLYCTCSIFKAEGQDQVQTFVAHNTDALLLPSPGHLWPQSAPQPEALRDNHLGAHDGFFYALLRKTPLPV
jgi:16S rRNA (cytosine967-C5)-methyltransferase